MEHDFVLESVGHMWVDSVDSNSRSQQQLPAVTVQLMS